MSKRIGILGGGQLGLLLAQSLVKLGCEVAVYDPDADAPACKQTFRAFNGSWTDEEKLATFFEQSDLITYEFENVQTDLLFALQKKKPMMPSASVLQTTQNRGKEKGFMRQTQLPHPKFRVVAAGTDLVQCVAEFGLPCIAKTTFGGYDGKGQFLLQTESDVQALRQKLAAEPKEFILEEKIALDLEVSCIVGRSRHGEEIVFPVFENQHRDHILDVTILPARIPHAVEVKVKEIARLAARGLEVVGLLTIEFFLTQTKPESDSTVQVDGWYILINEFAPRPHNSGHITMKACDLSQYDILARVLADVPLQEPKLLPGSYCMGNLLGDVWLAQNPDLTNKHLNLWQWKNFPQVIDLVIYGKTQPRDKRKMGHFIVYGSDSAENVRIADDFRTHLRASR